MRAATVVASMASVILPECMLQVVPGLLLGYLTKLFQIQVCSA